MRRSGSQGQSRTTRQKGLRNRERTGVGTYARKKKGRQSATYDRPWLDGQR
jgi:hypothetical protein